jgi:hypothetical protein
VAMIAAVVRMYFPVWSLLLIWGEAQFEHASPWHIALVQAYLYWIVPAALVIWGIFLLISRAGREERLAARVLKG